MEEGRYGQVRQIRANGYTVWAGEGQWGQIGASEGRRGPVRAGEVEEGRCEQVRVSLDSQPVLYPTHVFLKTLLLRFQVPLLTMDISVGIISVH